MKIFIVCARLCDGGAERVAVTLANGFADKGHQVTVVSNLFLPQTYVVNETVSLKNLIKKDKGKVRKWIGAIVQLRNYLQKEKPDVIIGIMSLCSVISRIAAIGLKIPVVMTEHDAFERPPSAAFSKMEYFSKFYLNRIFRYITVLTETDNAIVRNRFKNVAVMPNPLALQSLLTVPEKKKYILAAGRLDDWHYKGFDNLLRAWAMISELYPGWKLQIAGREDSRYPGKADYLYNLAKDLGLDNRIDFLGYRTDMETLYKYSSIFVLSSRYEGFGLVLIEAMGQGCACVACDYKGRQREIIRNENEGIICKPEHINELAHSISRLINDEQYRMKVQKHAVERSKYYSIENIIKRWELFLSKIVIHH